MDSIYHMHMQCNPNSLVHYYKLKNQVKYHFSKTSQKFHFHSRNSADFSSTSNTHNLSILYPKCKKFISIESSKSPLQISLRPCFHILSVSTRKHHNNEICPETTSVYKTGNILSSTYPNEVYFISN